MPVLESGTGVEFLDLLDHEKLSSVEVPPEAATVTHTFYRKADAASSSKAANTDSRDRADDKLEGSSSYVSPSKPKVSSPLVHTTPGTATLGGSSSADDFAPATAQPTNLPSDGMISIHLPPLLDDDRRPIEILADAIKAYGIPDEDRFELLAKIRCAAALGKGPNKLRERENLTVIRLLSIAVFGVFARLLAFVISSN
jgi:E3 ubiquitin-protein ligase HUWE1